MKYWFACFAVVFLTVAPFICFANSNIDTIVNPVNSINNINSKVIISETNNNLEITPYSSFNNNVLIEPINRATNKGLSTAFFLKDTSSWSFYTNSIEQLKLSGKGNIITKTPLLINNAIPDGKSYLRVNGRARFDSTLFFGYTSDSNSFISFEKNVKNAIADPGDGISAYTTTPIAWANNNNIPAFRIRHPLDVTDWVSSTNISLKKDFLIVPYQYGMAIEYNGVVECWVGAWSIHKGLSYVDVEGKGNGWGGVLWVGDDVDRGGVRVTARNNLEMGGNVNYGELSVEKFIGEPNGDFRFRLPSTQNDFHFVYGEKGSTNIIAKMKNQGLVLPKISTVTNATSPERAQVVFDSTDKKFKGYDGSSWISLSDGGLKVGSFIASGNATVRAFNIPHGLGVTPTYFNVIATSAGAANISFVTANATSIIVNYTTAPTTGTNNLSWNWQVKK